MAESKSVARWLIEHFFRRFFDNDTIQVEGDTQTTVARAVAATAVPGLMFAFFLQTAYSAVPPRPLWARVQDQYFFVLFSFVVMGAAAIFEWEMLFPDKLDFLILTPLSIKPMQMLAAKAAALIGFLTIFLVSSNVLGAVMLPGVSKGDFLRQAYAHSIAVLLAGTFAALFFVALCGVLLCVLDAARFRLVSPLMQMFSVMALVLLMLHYLKYGDEIRAQLSGPGLRFARWVPSFWFLGVYEWLWRGDAAPAFAREFAGYAVRATGIVAASVVITYPIAWARMRRMTVEGTAARRGAASGWADALLHRLVSRPAERAMLHFIGQTMARNNRYQVYLAMYGGTGLALALACAITLRASGAGVGFGLSDRGLHAAMPLLVFWVIAGLRSAFAFPLNLPAGWVFRVSGVDTRVCADGARRWVLWCAMGVCGGILIALRLAGRDWRLMLVQAVCGVCLCVLLTDGFFWFRQGVPFNQPRMPGKTNLPLMLTLYIGVLPVYIYAVIGMEMGLERRPLKLILLGIVTAAIHLGLRRLRQGPEEIEEEMEGYEGEFQLLGLS